MEALASPFFSASLKVYGRVPPTAGKFVRGMVTKRSRDVPASSRLEWLVGGGEEKAVVAREMLEMIASSFAAARSVQAGSRWIPGGGGKNLEKDTVRAIQSVLGADVG